MSDKYVRTIGRVEDMDGYPVAVGVDYDTVTIGVCRLDPAMQEEFGRLFVAAVRQAGQLSAVMAEDAAREAEPDRYCATHGRAHWNDGDRTCRWLDPDPAPTTTGEE